MDNTEKVTAKRLLWPTVTLAITVTALVLIALAGRASASSISTYGAGVPLAQPTIPATVVPGTPVSTVVPGSPTVPRPRPTGQPTAPACNMSFSDVHTSDWFYLPVDYLYCKGVISGYADGTFRPNNPTTRGQMAKIAMGAFPFPTHTEGGPHFTDVTSDNAFYSFIETAYHYSIIGGYPCGGPGEPCDSQNLPYFRPSTQVTRGQLTKIIVLTAAIGNPNVWHLLNPATPTFADVAAGSTFYTFAETAVAHGVLSGYACGGPNEPCDTQNRPYFRLNRNATRAQLSKIVYGAVTAH